MKEEGGHRDLVTCARATAASVTRSFLAFLHLGGGKINECPMRNQYAFRMSKSTEFVTARSS